MVKVSSSIWFVRRPEFALNDHVLLCYVFSISNGSFSICIDSLSAFFTPIVLFLAIVLIYNKEKMIYYF